MLQNVTEWLSAFGVNLVKLGDETKSSLEVILEGHHLCIVLEAHHRQVCTEGHVIEGYASLFGTTDQGGDIVQPGAYKKSLRSLVSQGRSVKMLWQHDPAQPIGIWDEVYEDSRGLWVKGRILSDVEKGREAIALLEAGAIDGLSIGYRTIKSQKNTKGQRELSQLDLWEVSLVTFPMLPQARVGAKNDVMDTSDIHHIARMFREATELLKARA